MRMHNPPHPGEVLRGVCLEPLGLTVTQAASALDVSRKTLSAILNGRPGICPAESALACGPRWLPTPAGSRRGYRRQKTVVHIMVIYTHGRAS